MILPPSGRVSGTVRKADGQTIQSPQVFVGSNKAIMGAHVNGPWLNTLGWLATAVMFAAAIGFFVTLL